jgi:glycosyltransferase involved in cell wall biosynthesis
LDAKKGLDLLLQAFAQVLPRHPDAALVIAGDGDPGLVSRLKREAKSLGVSQPIVWAGFLAGEDKLAALAAADLFVLPSYSENFGVAAVEALAAGLPVVLTDQVGIAAEVEASQAGLVVPPDVDSLTAALDRLLSDSALRQTLVRNAHQLVDERFSLDAMTRRLLGLYREVIQGSTV